MSTAIAIPSAARAYDVARTGGPMDVAGPKRDVDAEMRREVGKFVAGTFFGIMMKAMRSTVPEDGLMNGGRAEEIFRQMFDVELTDRFAESSNFPQVEAAIRQLSGKAAYRERLPMRGDEPAYLAADTAMTMRRNLNLGGTE